MNVTLKQKEVLLNLLQENPELIRGRIRTKGESRRKLNTIWDEVAAHLNTIEGPQKSGKEWAKTWQDIKGYILKKEAKRRTYTQGTGGGSPPKIAFSNFEENVLRVLTPEAAGLENIPEGGFTNEIPNVNCDTEQIITELDMRHVSENEQTLQMNYSAEEMETRQNIENIPPNYKSTNTKRGGSMQQLSHEMLLIQVEKLELKKEEIKLRKKH